MAVVRFRRPIVVFTELILVVVASYLAFWLRFDGSIPQVYRALFWQALPYVILTRGLMFIPFRLYEGLWRYTSLWDVEKIVAAVLSSTVVIQLVFSPLLRIPIPRGVIVIEAILLMAFMTGIRMARRVSRELWHGSTGRSILVYGANDTGEMVVRDMKNNSHYNPVGFIDDNGLKVGHRIHGVQVLGTRDDVKKIIERTNAQEILIALPNASAKEKRDILKALEPFKVRITTLPNLHDLVDGKVTVDTIRGLALEDLLQRAPVGLDPTPVRSMVEGRRVVITGAGGSIGSELCRQIARMRPEILVMIDRHEHSLYSIQKEFMAERIDCEISAKIADITDSFVIAGIFKDFRPHIIFHAAAFKHVPMMEDNACEAIKNNVRGTRIVAEQAVLNGVERFILISSDKAVNPSSVMGATKRVAELMIQSMALNGKTCLNAVRFGNVLGSTGSVVPLFLEQIRAGGPLTVTHPEMRRYFMLIPEAVQLVLHAATLGNTGTVYVLEMGDEFKIVDLAKNLIRLSGFVPDEEISIEFIGVRPGEKISEILTGHDETLEPSSIEKILQILCDNLPEQQLLQKQLTRMEAAAIAGRTSEVLELLREMVPTFQPAELEKPVSRLRAASSAN